MTSDSDERPQPDESGVRTPRRTRVILVRHGEVEDAWRGRLYGCHDVGLSPNGEREARTAAERVRRTELARVVSSGLRRTRFGAERIAEGRAVEALEDPEPREIDRGVWVGLRPHETEGGWTRWHAAPDRERAPRGESLTDLAARVLPRIAHHAAAAAGDTIAVVAHSWVVRVTACHALGLPLSRAARLTVPTGSLAVVDWPFEGDPGHPTLAALGADRLPPDGRGWYRGPRRSAGDAG